MCTLVQMKTKPTGVCIVLVLLYYRSRNLYIRTPYTVVL